MKNWKDDWRSSAILGELVAQLTRRERIRQLLGEVQEGDADTLIREALDELEGILERRWSRPTFAVSPPPLSHHPGLPGHPPLRR